jgi:hypothetical protein
MGKSGKKSIPPIKHCPDVGHILEDPRIFFRKSTKVLVLNYTPRCFALFIKSALKKRQNPRNKSRKFLEPGILQNDG